MWHEPEPHVLCFRRRLPVVAIEYVSVETQTEPEYERVCCACGGATSRVDVDKAHQIGNESTSRGPVAGCLDTALGASDKADEDDIFEGMAIVDLEVEEEESESESGAEEEESDDNFYEIKVEGSRDDLPHKRPAASGGVTPSSSLRPLDEQAVLRGLSPKAASFSLVTISPQ